MHGTCGVAIGTRTAWLAIVLASATVACTDDEGTDPPAAGGAMGTGGHRAGAGGSPSTGGSKGAGGANGSGARGTGGAHSSGGLAGSDGQGTGGGRSTGGRSGAGGSASTGGATGTGGRTSPSSSGGAAGRSGTGGSPRTVGSAGTGGVTGTGGSKATGGVTGTGGSKATGGVQGTGGSSAAGGSTGTCGGTSLGYDQAILCDRPVAYLAMNRRSGSEPDLTGNGHPGTYKGGAAGAASLPNGDQAADFDGSSQYLTVPSSPAFSIPTTGELTWEAWIRPAVLQFPHDSGGYVDWMGKCAEYSPTCEWEARLYNTTNSQNRCNRFSAYVFNPSAGLGSGADWQPTCGLIQAETWYHVVGEYTLESQPADCPDASTYPGSIDIWVNGVKWHQASHGDTGCMSQYDVTPKANDSPVNIGTMAGDAWFQGAIAKVAIYDRLLTQTEVTAHYKLMTGQDPTGSCANTCSF